MIFYRACMDLLHPAVKCTRMSKLEYQYNPDTLSFDKVKVTFRQRLGRLFLRFLSSLFLGAGLFIVYWLFFDSPKEKALKRELEEVMTQYHLLSSEVEQLDNILQDMEQRDDNIYRVIFEAEPIPKTIRRAGSGGVNRFEHLKHLSNSELIIETSKRINELSKAIYVQSKSYDAVEVLARNKIDMLASIPAILPLSFNKENVRITSSFGFRIHPIYKINRPHTGMDFSGRIGMPIYATGNGLVESTAFEKGYGRKIVIDHGYGYKTVYAHLDKSLVKKGQQVKRGDIIGHMGNTGVSSGPHLHYEVRKNDKAIDPINFYFNDLTADDYDSFVEIANNTGQSMD